MALGLMDPAAKGLDVFTGRTSAHMDHCRSCEDRQGKITEAGHGHSAIGRKLFRHDILDLEPHNVPPLPPSDGQR